MMVFNLWGQNEIKLACEHSAFQKNFPGAMPPDPQLKGTKGENILEGKKGQKMVGPNIIRVRHTFY